MKKQGAVFLTGATGLLGSQLGLQALSCGRELRVLVRSVPGVGIRERVTRAWSRIAGEDLSRDAIRRLRIVEGDAALPRFGLSPSAYRVILENVSDVFHAAGHTDFVDSSQDRHQRSNVDTTRRAFESAREVGATLHHVSTAYVAPISEGVAFEHNPTTEEDCRNSYERSKIRAERFVLRECRAASVSFVIYRPSILVGSSRTGRSAKYRNFYVFLRALDEIRKRAGGRRREPIRLALARQDTLNLIPVDHAAKAIWRIAQQPESIEKWFHICHPTPCTIESLLRALERIYPMRFRLVESLDGRDPSRQEKLLAGILELFGDYLQGEPEFSLRNTCSALPDYRSSCPPMESPFFRKMIDGARGDRWGRMSDGRNAVPASSDTVSYCETYYSEFLKEKINKRLIENLRTLDAVIEIRISDHRLASRVMTIEGGVLTSISKDHPRPECAYTLSSKTFQEITRATVAPQEAFFNREIEITGDVEKGLMVAFALAEFFRRHPYVEKRGTSFSRPR